MDCILRVISGPDTGETARLQPGPNLIGRSPKAALKLRSPDISWEHCSITRSGDEYVAENLSALGTYIDDAKLAGPAKLRARDQLRLSKDTVVRFEAVGSETGLLAGRRGIVTALAVMLVGLVALVAWDLLGPEKLSDDWDHAYHELEPWVSQETAAKRLPAETAVLFRDAWRLEQAENYERSSALWLRLQLALDSVEGKAAMERQAAEHRAALQHLLTPPRNSASPDTLDEEKAAAFAQFVKRRLDWSSRQSRK